MIRSMDGNGRASANGSAPRAPAAARQTPQRSGDAFQDAAMIESALAVSRQQLNAALRDIEALRKRDALLREQVTALAQTVAKLRRFAHRDQLTGLPNRHLLMDRFNQAIAQCERQQRQVALLFLDLDGFKGINDMLGHSVGDSLLQQVAARLASCVRVSDTVCRYGGDEFVVLLPEVGGQRCAAAVLRKIRAHLATPYMIAGTEIRLSASIGMAVYPVDGKAYNDLMHVSDREMYRNKNGRAAAANTARLP
jgi:diguanylate cyclase (GGDEF)-like protein